MVSVAHKTPVKAADIKSAKNVALAKIKAIMTDPKTAEVFFYSEMAPKMAAIAKRYNDSFDLDLTKEDVSTATYLSCWENDWAKLKVYKGDTSPHAWVARIASQATYRFLLEEHYIDGAKKLLTDERIGIDEAEKKEMLKEIPWQRWHDRIDEGDVSDHHRDMREILGIFLGSDDWDDNVKVFVEYMMEKLDWDERERFIFTERFFHDTPSKELAVKYEVRNTWIDNVYSRLNKRFRAAVRVWWNNIV